MKDKLREFHLAFGVKPNQKMTRELLQLRFQLLDEEFREYTQATAGLMDIGEEHPSADLVKKMRIELLDALADMTVVIYGTADVLGFDLDEALQRVHASNMSKLDKEGNPIINDGAIDPTRPVGKILKSDCFFQPDLEDLV